MCLEIQYDKHLLYEAKGFPLYRALSRFSSFLWYHVLLLNLTKIPKNVYVIHIVYVILLLHYTAENNDDSRCNGKRNEMHKRRQAVFKRKSFSEKAFDGFHRIVFEMNIIRTGANNITNEN
uniref:Uncharacterized protein n=1 Tax=Glossina pallidipes TaxID=7398 RepID=A0A1B0A050_GLOPL